MKSPNSREGRVAPQLANHKPDGPRCCPWNSAEVGGKGNDSVVEPAGTKLIRTPQGTTAAHRHEQEWEAFIRQVAQGDQAALGAFYDATSRLVYGLALRIVGNTATAEEVTIEVYTQVWRQAAVYDAKRGAPSAWLLTLTRSRAIDRLRADTHKRWQDELPEGVTAVPTATPNPEEASVVAEQHRFVQTALAALGPEQREAIELAYFSGLSHSEIAARLRQPLGTVKTRIRLGMLKLRKILRPFVEQP